MARIAEAYLIMRNEAHLGGNAKAVLNALQVKRGATLLMALEKIYWKEEKNLR